MIKAKYPNETVRMTRFDMDHKEPVVPLDQTGKEISWDVYYERMFCPEDNYQGLCLQPCHQTKTAAEKKQRLAHKYGKK